MNALREFIESPEKTVNTEKRSRFTVLSSENKEDKVVLVDGRVMSKHELNEKLAYFYENGGPVMDI